MTWALHTNEVNGVAMIMPENDEIAHDKSSFCDCDPVVDVLENGWIMITHHSYDGREAIEMAYSIINPENYEEPEED